MWSRLPRLATLFGNGRSPFRRGIRHGPVHSEQNIDEILLVDGFAVFRTGIKPTWEDARNTSGGEWACRKGLCTLLAETRYA